MVTRNECLSYLETLLEPNRFQDYCPNGLQVAGNERIENLVSGVTASQSLIDAALDLGADTILVHHGYFWRGEDPRVIGIKKREPLIIQAHDRPMERVGWCSGAAQGYIEQAAELGLDAFISGEISEQTVHLARELGINYFAAGHHATERYGVKALGEHLAEKFALKHEFIDCDNPV